MTLLAPDYLAGLSDSELSAQYIRECARFGVTSEADAERVFEREVYDAFDEEARIVAAYPLAGIHLWRAPDAPWDQHRLVAHIRQPLTLVLGGNRGGKTFAIMNLVIAHALGRDHPMIATWIRDNDLDPLDFPLGPGEVYCVANAASGSIRYHRLDIEHLLPAAGCHWRNKEAQTEASVEITVPGYRRTARIWFKSVDQKHRAFKGDEVRFVAISEEPEGDEGKLVLAECLRACSSVGGKVVLEMTPQNGMTWVYDDLVVDRQHNCVLIEIDSDLNTMMPDKASHTRWLDGLTPEERAMRQFGRFTDRRGLVYQHWARGDGREAGVAHVIEPFVIPAAWARFRGGDWGQTKKNGTGALWLAVGPDDTHYIYREYYLADEPSYRVHATNVRALEPRSEAITGAWADHTQEAIDEFAAVGLAYDLADKEVTGGVSRCANQLLPVGGKARLKVFNTCTRFIWEIENYRRDPKRKDNAVLKENDHLMDCWRYIENGLEARHALAANSRAIATGLAALGRRR